MILLFDIGNTNTHLGLANTKRVVRQTNVTTREWFDGRIRDDALDFVGRSAVDGVVLCSVVPKVTPLVLKAVWQLWKLDVLQLTSKTVRGLRIDYPRPNTIGADRLANAIAARHHFGAPSVVVDFG